MPPVPALVGQALTSTSGAVAKRDSAESVLQTEQTEVRNENKNPNVPGNHDLCLEEKYEKLGVIGTGVYGTVYKARDTDTGMVVALKRLRLDDDWSDGVPAHVIREVSLLRDFTHPNIVQLLGIQVSSLAEYSLIFEYVETDLHKVLKPFRDASDGLPMSQVRRYSQELMSGIHACHVRLIIHRDLKPQNILIHPKDGLKICDFGLARLFSMPLKPYTHDVVTLWYRAPEILLGALHYGPEVDIWSAGCITAEMATGKPTFPGDSEVGTIFRIFRMLGTPTEDTWPDYTTLEHSKAAFPKWPPTGLTNIYNYRTDLGDEGIDFLRRSLCMNPKARIGSRRAKNHAFFKSD